MLAWAPVEAAPVAAARMVALSAGMEEASEAAWLLVEEEEVAGVEVALAAAAEFVAAADMVSASVGAAVEAELPAAAAAQAAASYLRVAATVTLCAWATLCACRLTLRAWHSLLMSMRTRTWCERTSSASTRSAASLAAPTRMLSAPFPRTTPLDSASAKARPTFLSLSPPLPARFSCATRWMLPRLRASQAQLQRLPCLTAASRLGALAPRGASPGWSPSPSRARRARMLLHLSFPLRPRHSSTPAASALFPQALHLLLQPRSTSAGRLCV